MLSGQQIKVYTDHKSMVMDALWLTCDRVYRWQLLLEENGSHNIYIKGVYNIVADVISHLDSETKSNNCNINAHVRNTRLVTLCIGYGTKTTHINAFQTGHMDVPIGTNTFRNPLESACANYSTITFMPHEDHERSAEKAVDDK